MLSTLHIGLRLCTISGILRTLAYSKLCLFRNIQAYSIISTLYSGLRLCTISGILRTLAYSKLCLFRNIQAHSVIIVIYFFTYILLSKIKKDTFFDYNDVNFNARPSLFSLRQKLFPSYASDLLKLLIYLRE